MSTCEWALIVFISLRAISSRSTPQQKMTERDDVWPVVDLKKGSGKTPSHKDPNVVQQERGLVRPKRYGGMSKKDMLGSVEESWGGGERIYGMFEVEADPPSRSTSPFRGDQSVRKAKEEALVRARAGTDFTPEIKVNQKFLEV